MRATEVMKLFVENYFPYVRVANAMRQYLEAVRLTTPQPPTKNIRHTTPPTYVRKPGRTRRTLYDSDLDAEEGEQAQEPKQIVQIERGNILLVSFFRSLCLCTK
jgi:hypothetical protein